MARKELKLSSRLSCLVIFDRFKAQCTNTVLQILEENHIFVVLVPANCIDRLKPLDVSINKLVKKFLRAHFMTGILIKFAINWTVVQ